MKFIVIGASGGLGSSLVISLRTSGYKVFGIDINSSPTVDIVLSSSFNLIEAINTCKETSEGPYTFVISIAQKNRHKGITGYLENLHDFSTILSFNSIPILQVASCLQDVAILYPEQSHIINIGSVLSDFYSTFESPSYGASKAAAKSLVRDLSLVLAEKNICINSISPALLSRNQASKEFINKTLAKCKVLCEPTSYDDIYKLVIFISTSGIRSLRGKDIVLDFGLESIDGFDLLSSQ